jgi:hypothetical protein
MICCCRQKHVNLWRYEDWRQSEARRHPPDVRDNDDTQTRTLFENCLGQSFVVADLESFDAVPFPLAKLDVGHVVGKQPWEHTIWVELEYLQVETP